jgi:raffinose/stachyose/melibiose transport system substrate-binding protein
MAVLLSGCAQGGGGALTCSAWSGYERFFALAYETYPEIPIERSPYEGGNRTGYSWAQMRADDIPDIFITSQILDETLAKERLADLSGYDFINRFTTSVLDQVAVDGGIYLLPVNYGMYGIFYNQTLMEEHGWQVPQNFAELEALCGEIREAGLIPGVLGTQLTGNAFSTVFNLAKTDWLTTPEGVAWESRFLLGEADAAGMWEGTMDYVRRYMEIGMFTTDPEDRNNPDIILDYLGNRRAVFCTAVMTVNITEFPETGDKIGMMPFISEDGSKNIYMYNPTSYIGISRRLTEPGNEEKLQQAVQLLSLLYSPEGQEAFLTEETPCVLSVLESGRLSPEALVYDAQRAMWEGRAFPMTYAGWEGILSDVGQAFKEWLRGEGAMDGPACIERMDALQRDCLSQAGTVDFCQAEADFTLEETGVLLGKALGQAADADAVLVPVGTFYQEGTALRACVTGRLYQGGINTEIVSTILPAYSGEYAAAEATGAEIKALAQSGFDAAGDGKGFPYVLVTRGDRELEDDAVYRVALLVGGYTEETAERLHIDTVECQLQAALRAYLTEQGTVSPGSGSYE